MDRVVASVRRHAIDVVVVLVAVAPALDVALRHEQRSPRSPAWFAVPVAAALVLALLARRRWPFGAPAGLWLAAAAVSFVDGRLIVFAAGVAGAGYAAPLLLGQGPDARRARGGPARAGPGSPPPLRHRPPHAPGG